MGSQKFEVGEKVLHLRWPTIKKVWPATIKEVLPRKWWQRQNRYVIDDFPDYRTQVVKEDKLIKLEECCVIS